jgi:hypothetical protein
MQNLKEPIYKFCVLQFGGSFFFFLLFYFLLLLLLLLLRWLYSPKRTFASLVDFSQSSPIDLTVPRPHLRFPVDFFRGGVAAPRPTPNLEDQVSIFISLGDRVAQLYFQAPGTHFSRLLRHAWATVGLFFSPVTTRGAFLFTNSEIGMALPWRRVTVDWAGWKACYELFLLKPTNRAILHVRNKISGNKNWRCVLAPFA